MIMGLICTTSGMEFDIKENPLKLIKKMSDECVIEDLIKPPMTSNGSCYFINH